MEYRSNKFNGVFRRAMWMNLGKKAEDFTKPKIAIINSSNNLAICYSHLDDIAKVCAEEVEKAGGVAFEVRTVAPSDFIHRNYVLPSRDLIAFDIEASVEGAGLDGMICLASCDKTMPGQMIAAARLNLPTIFIACGYQPCGTYKGKHFDIEDLFQVSADHSMGKITDDELEEMTAAAIKGPGVCQGIGTANTMHIATEALGFALPGSTPILANSPQMWEYVKASCKRIVEMVNEDLKPRDLLTEANFENSVKVTLSVCGSTNSMKHLQAAALAGETGINVFDMFEKYANDIPLLAAIRPNGDHFIDDMEAAGGTIAVMKQLESKLNLGAKTVTGKTVAENIKDAVIKDSEVIRSIDNAFNTRPAIVLAHGNIAETFGVIKLRVDDGFKPSKFVGPARVYDNGADPMKDLRGGVIQKGDVVVVRGQGITGTPGQGGAGGLHFALDSMGWSADVAVVTDGHASGLCNMCLTVLDITPEAAVGGNIGLIKDGDMITIDASNNLLHLDVSDEELAERRKSAADFLQKAPEGWLKVFQERVLPIDQGALIR